MKNGKTGFDLLSPVYDLGSRIFFGKSLLRSQIYFLDKLPRSETLLIFGGGTGQLLEAALRQQIAQKICYVDSSEKMIERSRQRILKNIPEEAFRVDYRCASWVDLGPPECFDIVMTPYVLDCFKQPELGQVISTLKARMNPEGKWVFTDFHIPAAGLRKLFSLIITRFLYMIFDLICGLGISHLPDFEPAFSRAGLLKVSEKYFLGGMLISGIYVQA